MKIQSINKSNIMNDYKKDTVAIIVLLIVIFQIIVIDVNAPDPIPDEIAKFLEKGGYNTENIQFTYKKNLLLNSKVYQSSEPVFYKGRYIELWQVSRTPLPSGALLGLTPDYIVETYCDDAQTYRGCKHAE